MALVPAKCTQCGANLEVDAAQEAAVCPFCHTPFIVEKAINHFNITNVTNIDNLHADVVNVLDSESQENLYKTGITFVQLKDYQAAGDAFEKMCQKYPFDPRSWYGKLMVMSQDFTALPVTQAYFDQVVNVYEKYASVQSGLSDQRMRDQVEQYVTQVEQKLGSYLNIDRKGEMERLKIAHKKNQQAQEEKNRISCEQISELSGAIEKNKRKIKRAWIAFPLFGVLFALLTLLPIWLINKSLPSPPGLIAEPDRVVFMRLLIRWMIVCLIGSVLIAGLRNLIGLHKISKLKKSKEALEGENNHSQLRIKDGYETALCAYESQLQCYYTTQKKLRQLRIPK